MAAAGGGEALRAEPTPGPVAGLGAAVCPPGHPQQAPGCDPPALFPRGLIAVCRQPSGSEVLQIAAVYLFTGTRTSNVFFVVVVIPGCDLQTWGWVHPRGKELTADLCRLI